MHCAVASAQVMPSLLSTLYESVVVFGRAALVTDEEERHTAIRLLGVRFADASEARIQEALMDTQLLPDGMTLPLLWIGLLLPMMLPAGERLPVDLRTAVIGAVAGYLSLWSVYHLFRLLTGKEGMGYGDFKLLAALGAWLGWQMLLPIIIGAAGVGALVGITSHRAGQARQGRPDGLWPLSGRRRLDHADVGARAGRALPRPVRPALKSRARCRASR